MSGWKTNSASSGVGFDSIGSHGDLLPVTLASGDLTKFSDTPPLQTLPDPLSTTITLELSESSWDLSLSTVSLSLSPTLQPSVLLSSDFTFPGTTPGLSSSSSLGFEDSRYATGSLVESFLPEVSGDRFPLASDTDLMCGCSLEPSVSSSWLHASPHVPLPSSAWDSGSLELSSSVSTPLAFGDGTDDVSRSLSVAGSNGPSFDQLLVSYSTIAPSSSFLLLPEVSSSDLPISVSVIKDPWFSPSDMNSALPPSALPSSFSNSPLAPTLEGQVLDPSSSASGSALFPDSQEGIDQDWDRVQTSASGEIASPYSTKVTNTVPSSTASESGQNPDDLDERSSTFYFEIESGSAITSEVGDTVMPSISVVNSTSPLSLGVEEQSGSGQGESLYDNETSSDFSISERTERESEEEEPVAGKRVLMVGKSQGIRKS